MADAELPILTINALEAHVKNVLLAKLAVKNETTLDPVFGNVIYPFIILIMSCIVGVFLNKL